jgi:predicted transcriptional regulator of viral defense system
MKLSTYIEQLQKGGRYTFIKKEAQKALNVTDTAIKYALHRLKIKGEVIDPVRGFYVIIPPEYSKAGCLPPEQFIDDIMHYLNGNYYVGLLSAAQLYGAAHQNPQVFQVLTNQKRRDIKCGSFKITFITKSALEQTPTQQFKTPRGYYLVSSPEATAMDLILYPQHGAGINNVLTILVELVEKIDGEKLSQLANTSKDVAWIQRLGYLLDFIGEATLSSKLHNRLNYLRIQRRYLLPNYPINKNVKLDKKWQVFINAELETDL